MILRNLKSLDELALLYKTYAHSLQYIRGRYFLVDFYAPTIVERIMEYLSQDINVIIPNIVNYPLTQEVKEC